MLYLDLCLPSPERADLNVNVLDNVRGNLKFCLVSFCELLVKDFKLKNCSSDFIFLDRSRMGGA